MKNDQNRQGEHLSASDFFGAPAINNGRVTDEAKTAIRRGKIGAIVKDVERETVSWLWRGRLAAGKVTVLDGDPGLGKSTLITDIAGRLTTGRPWPDGSPAAEAGGVVLVTVEDGIADTIRPRLEAAQADLSKVVVVQTVPSREDPELPTIPEIPGDLELIGRAADRVDARLLVIDPLAAHLGGEVNSHRDSDVRRALAPLSEFAERRGMTVVVVRHLNKQSGGSALYRGGGSIGIIGAARIGLLVGSDPDDEERRVLASTKSNLARLPDSLSFAVAPAPEDPETGCIEWLGSSPHTAQDLVSPPSKGTARDAAADWLRDLLAEGPRPASEIYAEGEAAGFAKRTLNRAKKSVDAESMKDGFNGQWLWKLNGAPRVPPSRRMPKSTCGNLRENGTDPNAENRPKQAENRDSAKNANLRDQDDAGILRSDRGTLRTDAAADAESDPDAWRARMLNLDL